MNHKLNNVIISVKTSCASCQHCLVSLQNLKTEQILIKTKTDIILVNKIKTKRIKNTS